MGVVTHLPVHQPVPDGYHTAPQVCDVANITYRQLDFWTRTGLLHNVSRREGSGFRRLYTQLELNVARHLGALTAAGLTASKAAPIARALARGQPTRLGPYQLTNPQENQQP